MRAMLMLEVIAVQDACHGAVETCETRDDKLTKGRREEDRY